MCLGIEEERRVISTGCAINDDDKISNHKWSSIWYKVQQRNHLVHTLYEVWFAHAGIHVETLLFFQKQIWSYHKINNIIRREITLQRGLSEASIFEENNISTTRDDSWNVQKKLTTHKGQTLLLWKIWKNLVC